MFGNPRRGRQAGNFTRIRNVPKILDLKSSSEQIFSKNWRWVPLKSGFDSRSRPFFNRLKLFIQLRDHFHLYILSAVQNMSHFIWEVVYYIQFSNHRRKSQTQILRRFVFCRNWQSSVVNHLKQLQGMFTKTYISSQFKWCLVWLAKINAKQTVGKRLVFDQKHLRIHSESYYHN